MTQYIDKSVVMAEINRVLNSYDPNQITSGRYALASLRDFLETLEAKEVDVEKESELIANSIMISVQANLYHTNVYNYQKRCYKHSDLKDAARKGIELGLKAQKGEFKKKSETNCPNFDEAQGTPITK